MTISGGPISITTATLSEGKGASGAGTFEVTGLPAPAIYEVTFSRSGLLSETREVQLLPAGAPDPPSDPKPSGLSALDVSMVAATGEIYGRVTDQGGKALPGIGVSVSSGRTTYAVTSVDQPVAGEYEIDGLGPVRTRSLSPGPGPTRLRPW